MRITLAISMTLLTAFYAQAELYGLLSQNGMSSWTDAVGDWEFTGGAEQSQEDEKLLVTKPGRGTLVNGPAGRTVNLFSKMHHGSAKLHVEFMVPRGSNSGVYLMGRYEIQVLDSWGVEKPESSDCGGIYQRYNEKEGYGYEGTPPNVNASKAPGEWQTFDIIFSAPKFDDEGKKIANAKFIQVKHNGIIVHENVEVTGPTRSATFNDEKPTGPLMLQGDHGPVAYRNIRLEITDKLRIRSRAFSEDHK